MKKILLKWSNITFSKQGVDIYTNALAKNAEQTDDNIKVTFEIDGKAQRDHG